MDHDLESLNLIMAFQLFVQLVTFLVIVVASLVIMDQLILTVLQKPLNLFSYVIKQIDQ